MWEIQPDFKSGSVSADNDGQKKDRDLSL